MRRPRLTIRARLTLVYGGLFAIAGVVFLGVTYVLVAQRLRAGLPTVDVVSPSPTGVAETPRPAGSQTFIQEVTDDALNSLLTYGGIALVLVSAAAIALGWLIAGQLLQPLNRVTEAARRIAGAPATDRGLHERLALDGPRDEVKELADTFDVMLERIDHAFDGQRRFIANASHELRTPLAVNRALLEIAVHRRPASAELRELGETMLEVNARHERLIDGLLLLTRSEAEIAESSYVDLADLADHVGQQVPSGTVRILVEPQEAPTTGSPVLLERLVQNLVENGVRYNVAENGWVRVTTGTQPDGSARLVVSNSGPVVPRYEIPNLFEPFHRLNTDQLSTPSGAGLGLSIVRAIARAHGGSTDAEPRTDGGLTVTVTLPGSKPQL